MDTNDFLQVTGSIADPFYLLNSQGEILAANPAACKMLGVEHTELQGKNLQDMIDENQTGKFKQNLRNWSATRQALPSTLKLCMADGKSIETHCYGNLLQPARDGNPALIILRSKEKSSLTRGFVALNDKIAELEGQIRVRLQAEQKIKQLNEELEERVKQRTLELQAANDHLQTSLQQLNATQEQLVQSEKMASLGGLVAGVAHEINTPVGVGVTAVTHFQMRLEHYAARYQTGELTRDDFESLLGTAADSSKITLNNLNRAAELIRSFKQVAVDQTSNELRTINLQEYLDEIVQSLNPSLKSGSHQVRVDCREEINIYNHPGALSQVITNLVMNSVIHGFDGRRNGLISIKVSAKSNGRIELDYRDNGKGIAPENVDKVFEPFFTTRRSQGGTGLGMHIVYNLVTQTLGGQISCNSTLGIGTCFNIELAGTLDEQKLFSQAQA